MKTEGKSGTYGCGRRTCIAGILWYRREPARRGGRWRLGTKSGGIGVFSADGNQVASLSSAASGEVNITLYDNKTGFARAGLGLAADGAPALVLFDQNGKDRAELHVNSSGKPGLALADENGKSIAGLPIEQPAQWGAQGSETYALSDPIKGFW
jgi:hypothetical protein